MRYALVSLADKSMHSHAAHRYVVWHPCRFRAETPHMPQAGHQGQLLACRAWYVGHVLADVGPRYAG
jgi:hypothetical protein